MLEANFVAGRYPHRGILVQHFTSGTLIRSTELARHLLSARDRSNAGDRMDWVVIIHRF